VSRRTQPKKSKVEKTNLNIQKNGSQTRKIRGLAKQKMGVRGGKTTSRSKGIAEHAMRHRITNEEGAGHWKDWRKKL